MGFIFLLSLRYEIDTEELDFLRSFYIAVTLGTRTVVILKTLGHWYTLGTGQSGWQLTQTISPEREPSQAGVRSLVFVSFCYTMHLFITRQTDIPKGSFHQGHGIWHPGTSFEFRAGEVCSPQLQAPCWLQPCSLPQWGRAGPGALDLAYPFSEALWAWAALRSTLLGLCFFISQGR